MFYLLLLKLFEISFFAKGVSCGNNHMVQVCCFLLYIQPGLSQTSDTPHPNLKVQKSYKKTFLTSCNTENYMQSRESTFWVKLLSVTIDVT